MKDRDFAIIFTLLPLGASMFHKHMSSFRQTHRQEGQKLMFCKMHVVPDRQDSFALLAAPKLEAPEFHSGGIKNVTAEAGDAVSKNPKPVL